MYISDKKVLKRITKVMRDLQKKFDSHHMKSDSDLQIFSKHLTDVSVLSVP